MTVTLWQAVVVQALRDAAGLSAPSGIVGLRAQVAAWARSKDFAVVCALAGVDPGRCRERLEYLAVATSEQIAAFRKSMYVRKEET